MGCFIAIMDPIFYPPSIHPFVIFFCSELGFIPSPWLWAQPCDPLWPIEGGRDDSVSAPDSIDTQTDLKRPSWFWCPSCSSDITKRRICLHWSTGPGRRIRDVDQNCPSWTSSAKLSPKQSPRSLSEACMSWANISQAIQPAQPSSADLLLTPDAYVVTNGCCFRIICNTSVAHQHKS